MFLVTKEASESSNHVLACCGCCLACRLDCFNRFLRFMTKNAYMDTAINSHSFCKAAYNVVYILSELGLEATTLNVATRAFQMGGLGGIAAVGGCLTHLCITCFAHFSDVASPQYVENPLVLDLVAAFISAFVAWPFMFLIDHVSDTVLFCHAVDEFRTPPPPPPSDLD